MELPTTPAIRLPDTSDEDSRAGSLDVVRAPTLDSGWLADNMSALRSSNDFVEQNGLPLAKYWPV